MNEWYAVYTKPNAEIKASLHLKNQGFQVYMPSFRKRRRHARKFDWVRKPLFPRYIFLNMDMRQCRWRSISSTVGVSNIVSQADVPVTVPETLISHFKSCEDEKGFIPLEKLRPLLPGDLVTFVTGPLAEQVGIFERYCDPENMIVMLEILGRKLQISTTVDAVA